MILLQSLLLFWAQIRAPFSPSRLFFRRSNLPPWGFGKLVRLGPSGPLSQESLLLKGSLGIFWWVTRQKELDSPLPQVTSAYHFFPF